MLRFRIYFLRKANVSTSTGPLSWMNIILFHFVDIEKFVAGKINFRERITVWIMELFWEMKWILRKNKFKHTPFPARPKFWPNTLWPVIWPELWLTPFLALAKVLAKLAVWEFLAKCLAKSLWPVIWPVIWPELWQTPFLALAKVLANLALILADD